MLEAVRRICVARGVEAQLALEAGMACGFGACFGCVVCDPHGVPAAVRGRAGRESRGAGGGLALSAGATAPPAVDLRVDLAGVELEHPVLNGSGTFDAIAALRTFGDEVRERFPFSAFVSKTITLAPRGGNPPPRLWETPAGLINSIGLPNKGLRGSWSTTCRCWPPCPCP